MTRWILCKIDDSEKLSPWIYVKTVRNHHQLWGVYMQYVCVCVCKKSNNYLNILFVLWIFANETQNEHVTKFWCTSFSAHFFFSLHLNPLSRYWMSTVAKRNGDILREKSRNMKRTHHTQSFNWFSIRKCARHRVCVAECIYFCLTMLFHCIQDYYTLWAIDWLELHNKF